jgi:transcriptional regulator with XRE-family HTH domain
MPRTIRYVDAWVGARLQLRRKELGLSQAALGEKLGVTFQQIQKYEKGKNRVSAGVLYEISKALDVPVGYFFEDFEEPRAVLKRRRHSPSRRTGEAADV